MEVLDYSKNVLQVLDYCKLLKINTKEVLYYSYQYNKLCRCLITANNQTNKKEVLYYSIQHDKIYITPRKKKT